MRIKKPTLEAMFISACRYVAAVDASKNHQTIESLKRENDTFYERVVEIFVRSAVQYYPEDTVHSWINKMLLEIRELPKLN